MKMLQKNMLGIDVGGTKIAATVVDKRGAVLAYKECPTEAWKSRAEILDKVWALAKDVHGTVEGAGVGIPGFVKEGRVVSMPHIPNLVGCPLQKILEERWDVPVAVENDARCFTWAEWKRGAAQGAQSVVGLTFGTGVGGGVILDGKLYRGMHGAAGEVGHMVFLHTKKEWEALVAGRAWKQNRMLVRDLAAGIANVVYAFDPEIIVVGGGLAKLLPWSKVRREADRFLLPALQGCARITQGKLGAQAGCIGAALLAQGKV